MNKYKKIKMNQEIVHEQQMNLIDEMKKNRKYFYIALLGLSVGLIIKWSIGKYFITIIAVSVLSGVIWIMKTIQAKIRGMKIMKKP